MSAGQDLDALPTWGWNGERAAGAGTSAPSLPVRWVADRSSGHPIDRVGGVDDVVRSQIGVESGENGSDVEPDAAARGWVRSQDGAREDALFVLAGRTLGVSPGEQAGGTRWLDLDELVNLDALGDPEGWRTGEEVQAVEVRMADGTELVAGWPQAFCDEVVATLQRLVQPTDQEPAVGEVVDETPAPAEETATPVETVTQFEPAPTPTPTRSPSPFQAPSPRPANGATSARAGVLELEDVVYLGGYPGMSKRRKKCTATLSRNGFEVRGPGDVQFRLAWDVVRTIEVQNSDQARFRMNAKIHRDASALVVECDQGVTILLEARDCPTIALRSAIGQLMTDLPVVVV